MDNSRLIAVRDLLVSLFNPDFISYEYPYWFLEGNCSKNRDIVMEIIDSIPGIIIEGFSLRKIDQEIYRYTVKFSFEEDKNVIGEVFNFQDDIEEE
ncbi:MAG: hypothetical protein N2712_00395 [Brevinematales bacterium]|nr:hypothetical protein [Brevinematales bacterium]